MHDCSSPWSNGPEDSRDCCNIPITHPINKRMSRKKSFPFPSGDLLLACIQPRPLRGGVFGFRRFGSPRISAAMPTPVDGFQVIGFILPWALDADPWRSYASPCVGFQCQPSSYGRLEAYGFFGLCEGA